jgi:transporter family protein
VTWLAYTLMTIALWALWGFLGKISLRTITPTQATILFGLASFAVAAIALAAGQRTESWTRTGVWVGAISALGGAAGIITFSLALQKGKASVVAPMIGVYPAIIAVLSVAFLGERLGTIQIVGIVLAVSGAALIGAGG